MLTLLGTVEPCENPEKPGTGGIHILAYNFRGLVFPSMTFIHRAWVKTLLVCGEDLKVTKLIQIHAHPRLFPAQQRHDGWASLDGGGLGWGWAPFLGLTSRAQEVPAHPPTFWLLFTVYLFICPKYKLASFAGGFSFGK